MVFNEEVFTDEVVISQEIDSLVNSLANVYGGKTKNIYKAAVKGFSIETSEKKAIALSKDKRVKYIVEDSEVSLTDTQFDPPYGLDRIDQRDLPLNGTYTYNASGFGVTVYILDSGIDQQWSVPIGNVQFGSRIIVGADFVGDGRNGYDCNGHGTHITGIVGASTYGAAKNVFLNIVRAFDCTNNSPASTVIAAIDWIRVNRTSGPAVANMSFAGTANQAVDDAVRGLSASGVTCVVAAGNDSANANNYSPARVREAITVGATDGADNRADFSNYGTALDIFAPGVSITSTWLFRTTNVLSGTSQATPHVTGVVAQYLQTNQYASPADIQNVIVANASWGKINNSGPNSPNALLFVGGDYGIGGNIVPLYRYRIPNTSEHSYTTNWTELGAGLYGYTIEGIQGKIFAYQGFSTVPFYRYFNVLSRRHFYTTNFSELGGGSGPWTYEGITGYVYPTQEFGTVPLYRYLNTADYGHFYTTNFSELGGGGGGDWVYEGIQCYIIE